MASNSASKTATKTKVTESKTVPTWTVAIYTYKPAEVSRVIEKDSYGFHYGTYGCGDEPLVSVQCLIRDEKNYTVSGYKIDNRLPAKLFAGKKEGDTVVVPVKGKGYVTLALRQKIDGHQVPFEDVFKKAVSPFFYPDCKWCVTSPSSYTPEVSREMQTEIFEKFCASLGYASDNTSVQATDVNTDMTVDTTSNDPMSTYSSSPATPTTNEA
jgi:hypothetical protein